MKKLLFVMPQLGGGGAERVVLNIINGIDRTKFDINLILVSQAGSYFDYLKEDIHVSILNKKVRYSLPFLIKEIKKIKPDVIFSSIRGISVLLMLAKKFLPKNIKYIFREMNTPSESMKNIKYKKLMKCFYNNLESESDLIICQSKFMKNDFINTFNYSDESMVQIYNPVDTENIDKQIESSSNPMKKDKLNIVSIGRFSHQKNHQRLIESLPKLVKKFPNAHVYLLGDGNLKQEVNNLIDSKELNEYVTIVGFVENPYEWMHHCDLYVLHSDYEGLPNSLLEAIYSGAPVVSTRHPGGTKEILDLTNQSERYVDSLTWEKEWLDKESSARELLFEHFNQNKIVEQYNNIFQNI